MTDVERAAPAAAYAGPAIEIRGLVKRFGNVTAVAGIDLTIQRGECVGLLGPNGAGKTTTLEIIEGLQQPTEGEVIVLGQRWSSSTRAGLRARIGVQLQETRLQELLTVRETLALYASFYPSGMGVGEALALVSLEEKARARVGVLSGGQRQRLALAAALMGDPDLLFLDEPTTGLDPQSRRALWDVVEDLKRRGKTIILTTHYMEEAERLCSRIVIVDHGRVVAEGTSAALISRLGGPELIELHAVNGPTEEALRALPGVSAVTRRDHRIQLSVSALHATFPALSAELQRTGAELLELSTRRATLDDVFLALVGRALREEEPSP